MALADVGASAGLNLSPTPSPPRGAFATAPGPGGPRRPRRRAARASTLSPLDATSPEDADWLRACVWPGDRVREERLEAALAAFAAARARPDAPVLLPVAIGERPRPASTSLSGSRGRGRW